METVTGSMEGSRMKRTFCDICGKQVYYAVLGYKVTITPCKGGEYGGDLDVCSSCQEAFIEFANNEWRRRYEDEENE